MTSETRCSTNSEGDGSAEVVTQVRILNPAGLHARPAALIVERAKSFESEVRIMKNGKAANAKSCSVYEPLQ